MNAVKIGKGVGINFIGTLLNGVFSFLTSIIVARLFDARLLGVFSLGIGILRLVFVLWASGLRQAVVRYAAHESNKAKDSPWVYGTTISALKIALVSSLMATSILFFATPLIANALDEPELVILLRVFALTLPFFAMSTVYLSATRALQYMRYTVYVRKIIEPGLQLLLIVILFLMGFHLTGLAVSALIPLILGAILARLFFRRICNVFTKDARQSASVIEILKFSIPLTLSTLLSYAVFKLDTLFLGYYETSTNVGIYSAAIQVAIWISSIQVSLNTMVAPVISELASKREFLSLQKLFQVTTRWAFTISFPLFLFVVLFRQQVLTIFGQAFEVGSTSLILVSLGQLALAMSGPSEFMLIMSGYPRIHFYNNVALLAISLLMNILLIPKFGILGASVVNATLWILVNIAWIVEVYLVLGIHPMHKGLYKPLVAGLCSFALACVAREWILPVDILFGNIALALTMGAGYLFSYSVLGFDKAETELLLSAKGFLTRAAKASLDSLKHSVSGGSRDIEGRCHKIDR